MATYNPYAGTNALISGTPKAQPVSQNQKAASFVASTGTPAFSYTMPGYVGVQGLSATNNTANNNTGSNSQLEILSKTDRNPVQETEYQELLKKLNGGQDETNRQIDEAYGGTFDYLNQAESALREDYPKVQQDIENQFSMTGKQFDANRDQTFGTLSNQENQAFNRNESVVSDARRLYDELRRGYGQRFGGSSSAGQAATELSNMEQQRQAGKTSMQYTDTINQIQSKRVEVERDYQLKTEKLQYDKTAALNEANREFQSKVLSIASNKAQAEQAKAQARLSALQDLRNKVYQINLSELEFKQNLTLQYQQNQAMLAAYQQNSSQATSSLESMLGQSLNTGGFANPTSDLTTSTNQIDNPANQYLGITSRLINNKDDDLLF